MYWKFDTIEKNEARLPKPWRHYKSMFPRPIKEHFRNVDLVNTKKHFAWCTKWRLRFGIYGYHNFHIKKWHLFLALEDWSLLSHYQKVVAEAIGYHAPLSLRSPLLTKLRTFFNHFVFIGLDNIFRKIGIPSNNTWVIGYESFREKRKYVQVCYLSYWQLAKMEDFR